MKKSLLFVGAAVILAGLGLFFQARNAATSRTLATSVVNDDQNQVPATADIQLLKDFVGSHMGSSVTYTLTGSYNRAQAQAQAAQAVQNSVSQIYADAQKACSGKTDSITQARCNTAYINAHIATLPPAGATTPPNIASYTYKLRSPIWTADLAGALFLGAAAAAAMFVFTLRRRRY
jgi:hypothetical protein